MSENVAKLDSNAMALDRTLLAHDRTLMAWVRTSASMISFAFTIYKFFQFEQGKELSGTTRARFSPRDFAILMAAIGVVSLILAIFQYRKQTSQIRSQLPGISFSLSETVAVLISFFGLLVLVSAIVRR